MRKYITKTFINITNENNLSLPLLPSYYDDDFMRRSISKMVPHFKNGVHTHTHTHALSRFSLT
jgi:hypothetical protein